MTTGRRSAVSPPSEVWQRAAGGMVASASFQAEASAIRRGLLASRIVSAGLRAETGQLDDFDKDALATLVHLLDAEATATDQTPGNHDLYAFALATRDAAPNRSRRATSEDLSDVAIDAQLLLAAANAGGRRREKLFADQALIEAARRLVVRFALVSEQVMTEAGGPGDSLGRMGR